MCEDCVKRAKSHEAIALSVLEQVERPVIEIIVGLDTEEGAGRKGDQTFSTIERLMHSTDREARLIGVLAYYGVISARLTAARGIIEAGSVEEYRP